MPSHPRGISCIFFCVAHGQGLFASQRFDVFDVVGEYIGCVQRASGAGGLKARVGKHDRQRKEKSIRRYSEHSRVRDVLCWARTRLWLLHW
jgi:hypothetical protein